MTKILVLGASGMAGHVIATHLAEQGYEVVSHAGRHKTASNAIHIDLLQKQLLDTYLDENSFDVIINCVGILIQQSEERKDLAAYLNGFLPHYLEQRYKDTKTKLIHLSTDCVFSGEHGPYTEDSPFDGATFYDRSKALGEVINTKDLTFRMSIIGPDTRFDGVGLFNWFHAQTGTIGGFTNAVWNGVTTVELAKGIVRAIENDLTGLYHFVSPESITTFELVSLFRETFERNDITIEPRETKSTNKTLINTRIDFDYTVPPYATMVAEMKMWIDSHTSLYPHYITK